MSSSRATGLQVFPCAQRAGLLPSKESRAPILDRLVVRDERTRDWVREATHG